MKRRKKKNKALQNAVLNLRAVSSLPRLAIIALLLEEGELSVDKISEILKIKKTATSRHLRILRDEEILYRRRIGKKFYYSINSKKLLQIQEFIKKINS